MMSIKEESSFNNDDLLMIEDMLDDDVKQEPIQTMTVRNPKRLREIDLNAVESTAKLPDVVKIEKRNARERNRVRVVNDEFERLRRVVLGADYCRRRVTDSRDESNPGRKLSKLKILRLSIEYIQFLSSLLNNEVYTDTSFNNYQEAISISNHESDYFDFDQDFNDLPILMFNSENFF